MITLKILRFILAPALIAVVWPAAMAEVMIRPPGDTKSLDAGETLTLTCMHSGGGSVLDVDMKWFDPRGDRIVDTQGTKFIEIGMTTLSLKIIEASPADRGNYTCKAMIDGQEQQARIFVNVYEHVEFTSLEEQSVINGTDARVWCRHTPVSENKVLKWYQKNEQGHLLTLSSDKFIPGTESEVGKEGNYLLIKNVALDDSKIYVCSLEFIDRGESKNFYINVIVTVPPTIMPIYLDPPSPKEGDRLTMSCKANGIPPPTYMFYKGAKALMEERSSSGEYVIEDLTSADEGTYTCNAHNKGGSQDETVILDVRILPSFENTENVSQEAGSQVRLPCIATGDPAPDMYWRRKGSQVDYLSQENSPTDIYVEEVEDDPIRDGPSILHRRTLFLIIPELKPEHAGEYVCKADNQFGMKERTFKIDVRYQPNFNNQEKALFYGWVGSKTNLTCVANGNPEPLIKWYRGNENLAKVNGYAITLGKSGLSTRTISYLMPDVDSSNVDSVFGDYRCEAENKLGTTSQSLTFQRAEVPEMVTVTVIASKATELILRISPPANDGGQSVTKYVVKYSPADSSQDPKQRNINRHPEEDSSQVTLSDLTPKTPYTIRLYAVNNVGQGQEKKLIETTKDFSKPDPVKVMSPKEGVSGNVFDLSWEVHMTGGVPISNYVIEYSEAVEVDTKSESWKVVRVSPNWQTRNVDGQSNTRVKLTGLKQETYYQVKVKAVNRIGASDDTTFIFRTGRGVGPTGGAGCVRESVAGMLLVVMLTAFVPRLL